MTPEMIRMKNLGASINGREVLRDVRLNLEPGDIYGLLGPNGAGKSTTINILVGLLPREKGTVEVLGMDPVRDPAAIRQAVGVMPEKAEFYEWMNPREYLAWYGGLYGLRSSTQTVETLERVGLSDSMERPIGTFSRGMKQRLALARALTMLPRLLILDEPTNGLDPKGRKEVHDLLREYAMERGAGILLCTHILDDVDRLCNKIGIMDSGRTILEGPLADLTGGNGGEGGYRIRVEADQTARTLPDGLVLSAIRGSWLHVRVKPGFDRDVPVLWQKVIESGWRIREIISEHAGLTDLYMKTISSPNSATLQPMDGKQ